MNILFIIYACIAMQAISTLLLLAIWLTQLAMLSHLDKVKTGVDEIALELADYTDEIDMAEYEAGRDQLQAAVIATQRKMQSWEGEL